MNWSTSTPSFSRNTKRSRAGGFTLLEITVAMAIVALVLMTIYGVFSSVSGARERLGKAGEEYHQARVLFDRLGREIQGAYFATGNPDTLFAGGETAPEQPFLSLTTTATTPASGGRGISVVRYELVPDRERENGEKVLLRREYPMYLGADAEGKAIRLATGIAGMELRFFGRSGWQPGWDAATQGLPRLVEITLTVDGGAGGEAIPFRSAFEVPSL